MTGKLIGGLLAVMGVVLSGWTKVMAARSAAQQSGRSFFEMLGTGYLRGRVFGLPAGLWLAGSVILMFLGGFVVLVSS